MAKVTIFNLTICASSCCAFSCNPAWLFDVLICFGKWSLVFHTCIEGNTRKCCLEQGLQDPSLEQNFKSSETGSHFSTLCEDLPTDPRLPGPAHAMVWEDRAFCNVGICGLLKALQVSASSGEMGLVWGSSWRLGWGVSCFP